MPNCSGDDLFEHFSQAGTVESANVVQDRETGRSRGFGFVEMASEDEATNAITEFNGRQRFTLVRKSDKSEKVKK